MSEFDKTKIMVGDLFCGTINLFVVIKKEQSSITLSIPTMNGAPRITYDYDTFFSICQLGNIEWIPSNRHRQGFP